MVELIQMLFIQCEVVTDYLHIINANTELYWIEGIWTNRPNS